MIALFKFDPMQRVTITAFGLNCAGRVIRCTIDARAIITYDVEYAIESDIRRREFFEDELTEA